MSSKPLDILKKGLKILQRKVQVRKDNLQKQLHEKKSISSQDEKWLDGDANLVDEVQVIEALETASDYERGLGRLDEAQKVVVQKLREVGGGIAKVVGKKRQRALLFIVKPLMY
jgi:hypothetical protein